MSEVRNVQWKGTAAELAERLNQLPLLLTSDSPYGNMFRLAIGKAMLDTFAEAFQVKAAGGTDRFGIAWIPLTDFTVEKKGNSVILVEGGDLYESIKGSGQTILEAPASRIEIGTKVPYASFHQFGFKVVPGSPIRLGDKILGVFPKSEWSASGDILKAGRAETEVGPRPFIPTEDQLTEEWAEDVFRRAGPALAEAIAGAVFEAA